MLLLDRLAEEKIRAAAEAGAFDDLPGTGRPLMLDNDRAVPEELRAGYRLLKNAGYLPPELEWRRELDTVEKLLNQTGVADETRRRARRRLALLETQLGESRFGRMLRDRDDYHRRILDRLDDGAG